MRISRWPAPVAVVAGVIAASTVIATIVAAPISDNVDVKIDQWMTPSNPPYPHDPAVAPDGSVWYTGQRANVIGRFDPATQQFKDTRCPRRTRVRMGCRPTRTATFGTPATPRD